MVTDWLTPMTSDLNADLEEGLLHNRLKLYRWSYSDSWMLAFDELQTVLWLVNLKAVAEKKWNVGFVHIMMDLEAQTDVHKDVVFILHWQLPNI